MPDKHINELPTILPEDITPDKLMIIGDPDTGTLYQTTVGDLPTTGGGSEDAITEITADNGLTESPENNFQLGGTLSKNTHVDIATFTCDFSDSNGLGLFIGKNLIQGFAGVNGSLFSYAAAQHNSEVWGVGSDEGSLSKRSPTMWHNWVYKLSDATGVQMDFTAQGLYLGGKHYSGDGSGVVCKPCAVLELESTEAGLLLPRMTVAERNANIVTPVAGLMIFCTDATANDASTGVTQTYNGATWKNHW